MAAKPDSYATEAEMCAEFIAAIGKDWTAYPETAGWDILLVRKADGFQIGVEAKLRLNGEVLAQALEESHQREEGPDCRAVLVPSGKKGHLDTVAAYIGLTVITIARADGWRRSPSFNPVLPRHGVDGYDDKRWHDLLTTRRHRLPDYVPDVAAGSSAPTKLTAWKIAAIKVAVLLERRGFVTRADFKHLGIDIRRWLPREQGWLAIGEGDFAGGFVAGPHFPALRAQHPVNFEQIAADYDKWKPAEPLLLGAAP